MAINQNHVNPQARYPHLAKEPLITSRKRGNPENRFWAKMIDVLCPLPLLAIVQMSFPNTLLAVSMVYWIWIDSLGRGQSPGKWLLGLHTIDVHKGEKPRFYNGFIRNIPFILFTTALFKTGFIWGVISLGSLGAILIETYFIFILRSGVRVGDVLAYTRVFDFKDVHTQFIEQFLKKEEGA